MNNASRRINVGSLIAILFCVCLSFTSKAQELITPNSNTNTLSVGNVTTNSVEYKLKLVNPEVPVAQVVAHYKGKKEILSCEAQGDLLTIVTEPQITHKTIIGMAKVAGCKKTYDTYVVERDPRRVLPNNSPTAE